MEEHRLRILVAVAEEGSFTGAARRLHMTQSGVSRAIAALERELEVPLLTRMRGGVKTTDPGDRVLAYAREALSQMELIRQAAADVSELRTGRLRLGGFPSVCARLLPGLLSGFARLYPGMQIALSEGSGEEVVEWVRRGSVDAGFVVLPAPNLENVPVAWDRMVCVLGPHHPRDTGRGPVELARLAHEPFILPRGHHEAAIAGILGRAGIDPPVRFVLRDAGTILAMVREGLGWSIVNEMSLPPNHAGVRTQPITPTATNLIGLALRHRRSLPPGVGAFVEYVRSETSTDRGDALG